MSIAAGGEVFPELFAQAFPAKLAELWGEWYVNPKSRYLLVKRLDKILPKFLPLAEDAPDVASANYHKPLVVPQKKGLVRYLNPIDVTADRVLNVVDTFKNRTRQPANPFDIENERKSFVAQINSAN